MSQHNNSGLVTIPVSNYLICNQLSHSFTHFASSQAPDHSLKLDLVNPCDLQLLAIKTHSITLAKITESVYDCGVQAQKPKL